MEEVAFFLHVMEEVAFLSSPVRELKDPDLLF